MGVWGAALIYVTIQRKRAALQTQSKQERVALIPLSAPLISEGYVRRREMSEGRGDFEKGTEEVKGTAERSGEGEDKDRTRIADKRHIKTRMYTASKRGS